MDVHKDVTLNSLRSVAVLELQLYFRLALSSSTGVLSVLTYWVQTSRFEDRSSAFAKNTAVLQSLQNSGIFTRV